MPERPWCEGIGLRWSRMRSGRSASARGVGDASRRGGLRNFDDLPAQAQVYIRRVESLLGVPVDLISVGPEREQAIIVNPIF